MDRDLLAAAGMGSPERRDEALCPDAMDRWIDGLPRDEVTAVLRQLLDGRGQQAERTLKNRFAQWQRSVEKEPGAAPRRTVSQLMESVEAARTIRIEEQKREQKRREIMHREKREAYLKSLAEDFPKAWRAVLQTVEVGSGRACDESCSAIVDMAEAYSLQGKGRGFKKDFGIFMAEHLRRKALLARLVKAGLWPL